MKSVLKGMHQPFGNDEEFELQRQMYLDDLAALVSQVQDHTVPEQEARERLDRLKDMLARLEWYEEYMNLRGQGALPQGHLLAAHQFRIGCGCPRCTKHSTITMEDSKFLKSFGVVWNPATPSFRSNRGGGSL